MRGQRPEPLDEGSIVLAGIAGRRIIMPHSEITSPICPLRRVVLMSLRAVMIRPIGTTNGADVIHDSDGRVVDDQHSGDKDTPDANDSGADQAATTPFANRII